MRPRILVCRSWLSNPRLAIEQRGTAFRFHRRLAQRQWATTNSPSRPTLAFLTTPTANRDACRRTYASGRRRQWLIHEAKLFVRYATICVIGSLAFFTIYYFILEEKVERDYPTPPEWPWRLRKQLRDAHKWTDPNHRPAVNWVKTFELARNVCLSFEDVKKDGHKIPRLSEQEEPGAEVPWEFIAHDISGMSEEWRRGYYETMMLTAKAAEYLDGWVRDVKRNFASAPEYVIGPSNPRPKPIPVGAPRAPREEDCEPAFPPADRYYLKIFATKGFSTRQKIEAAFEYANFLEFKQRPGGAEPLLNYALAEATQGMAQNELPYNPKTFALKDKGPAPSLNVLDALTTIANYKARNGQVSEALPIYISLLKARRALPNEPPRGQLRPKPRRQTSTFSTIIELFSPPEYPPAPPDGSRPPWRSPEERCHEASLNLYIGEILYSTSSKEDGLAWTREGVDIAEEELRSLPSSASKEAAAVKQTCRECLQTGLDNWTVMVAKLIKEEQLDREKRPAPSVLSFWSSKLPESVEGRWEAERSVLKERVRRTTELVDTTKPRDEGFLRWFQA
ncbi:unnamed protein product [Clonostachys chloroleuca]|uniref:MFS maltose permease n=1 Tax=Clonostachys chloroleuca TaxID=1926264 RepID=A0AA35Q8X1_9HYPO|nr:unnamed protein product [Clonostachys chloroleuca]